MFNKFSVLTKEI